MSTKTKNKVSTAETILWTMKNKKKKKSLLWTVPVSSPWSRRSKLKRAKRNGKPKLAGKKREQRGKNGAGARKKRSETAENVRREKRGRGSKRRRRKRDRLPALLSERGRGGKLESRTTSGEIGAVVAAVRPLLTDRLQPYASRRKRLATMRGETDARKRSKAGAGAQTPAILTQGRLS